MNKRREKMKDDGFFDGRFKEKVVNPKKQKELHKKWDARIQSCQEDFLEEDETEENTGEHSDS